MKTIKAIFVTILIFLTVKGCYYVYGSISRGGDRPSVSNGQNNLEMAAVESAINTSDTSAKADLSNGERRGFRRYDLGNGVSLAIPEEWYVLPREEVKAVRATADQAYPGGDLSKETPFAANSSRDQQRHDTQARVSFVAKDFDQADIQAASVADLNAVCDELYNGWMNGPTSQRLIDRPQCSVTNLNGKTALLTRYTRAGNAPGTTWTVRMMQVPLESRMALITLSQKDGSATADQSIAEIMASLTFD